MASKIPVDFIKGTGILLIVIGLASFIFDQLNVLLTSGYQSLVNFDIGNGTGTLITLAFGIFILIISAILEGLKK